MARHDVLREDAFQPSQVALDWEYHRSNMVLAPDHKQGAQYFRADDLPVVVITTHSLRISHWWLGSASHDSSAPLG